jgi:DNA polymerase III subunit epsilon
MTKTAELFRRPVIVVDCECSGLWPWEHVATEVAWWNLCTDERGWFIPEHDVDFVLGNGDPKALEISRYHERLLGKPQDDGQAAQELANQLRDNTLAGSNPSFDAGFLPPITGRVWHHRMWDLSAYAAGKLNLDYLPGLADVCEQLEVDPPDHSAEGDVTATGLCLLKLGRMT